MSYVSYHRLHFLSLTSSVRCTCFDLRKHHLTPTRNFSMDEGIVSGNIVVGNTLSLQNKIAAIRAAGPSKLQVIADFDGTLTKYNIDGQRGHSSHALLQQGNPEYDIKRQNLYDHYHPLEICPAVPVEEKTKLMEEWWGKTHALLIEGGLTFDDIRKSVANARIAFREGVVELFELLEEFDVPILIFSAGLADIIEEVLRQKVQRSFKNIEIVSNRMVFDNEGNLSAFKGKTIHVLNKNEHALDMAAPLHNNMGTVDGPVIDYAAMKKRSNVLLLGDHIGDLGMSDGLDYETRISMGFLNDKVNESLESYCKAFDAVLLLQFSNLREYELFTETLHAWNDYLSRELLFLLRRLDDLFSSNLLAIFEHFIRNSTTVLLWQNDGSMLGVLNLLSQIIEDK